MESLILRANAAEAEELRSGDSVFARGRVGGSVKITVEIGKFAINVDR